ncbi:MAG: precorrin-6y C5,15-methyltransferase (decarboxylating) subunit CbiE [Pseudonocardiales bacterium]|nr:precorrin-6y C5,15-methyltransferase (decarboxylating) subunit CbiE [Pseudonocardiales bacterium]PZS36051.1 MAG: precorrin-6y C5,15-methyltransferase (decarboxylating) subunit CbiE [Pseudonocardiales bacterium]
MTVTVVGLDGAALPPGAAQALAGAQVVVGAPYQLANVPVPASARVLEPAELDGLQDTPTVVLASGDPGFFGIVRSLRKRGLRPVVLPARSSVARAFALLGRSWDDVAVVSAHGDRPLRRVVNVCRAHPAVAVLTGPGAGAAEIVAGLGGWRRSVLVAEDLGGPDERVRRFDGGPVRDPHIVLCLADEDAVPTRGWIAGGEPVPPAAGWALDEAEFSHRDGMITKSEVRALALARLAPGPGRLVWDLGAGSGSVGVECARLGAAVIAVERDPAQCARLVANASAHQVDVRVIEGEALAVLGGLPEPDAVFVGGGGPDVVRAAAKASPRVVVALAALDRLAPCRTALREAGHEVDGIQLAASRFAELPDGSVRLAATNPVLVLWGRR